MQSSCFYTQTVTITTTVAAGSLEAFATYLHSLADSYSHQDCQAQLDALNAPWGTHTIVNEAETSACFYQPWAYSAEDVHGREFLTYTEAYSHTDAAIRHIYAELSDRSLQREGLYTPLSLDTVVSGTQTLSETLAIYVHTWDYDHPAERRAYLDSLAPIITGLRAAVPRVYIPFINR